MRTIHVDETKIREVLGRIAAQSSGRSPIRDDVYELEIALFGLDDFSERAATGPDYVDEPDPVGPGAELLGLGGVSLLEVMPELLEFRELQAEDELDREIIDREQEAALDVVASAEAVYNSRRTVPLYRGLFGVGRAQMDDLLQTLQEHYLASSAVMDRARERREQGDA